MFRILTIFFCLIIGLCNCTRSTENKSNKSTVDQPNVIILFCDDMGYGDMGNTGHPSIKTPHLDRLVADGLRFSNYYSGSPACTASRYAILTGKYPVRSGFSWVLVPNSPRGIHAKETTIAEALKKEGYATACYGKWHLGTTQMDYLPLQNGFDEYFGLPYSNDMIPPKWPSIPLLEGNDTVMLDPDQRKLTRQYTERAIQFMDKHTEAPFFIYLPYAMPHVPLHPGEEFAGKSKRGAYGDVIEEIDWSVGAIRAALEEKGIAENTLLIFTSDNGPWIIKDELGGSSGLFRDGKGSTWEGGMHVPGFAYWKGRIQPGSVSASTVSSLDIFPSLMEMIVEGKTPNKVDGKDISTILSGQSLEVEEKPYFYYGRGNNLHAVRYGDWKLHILTYSQTSESYFEKEPPLLFNLSIDPSEKYEISEEYPEKVAELMQLVEEHQARITAEGNFFDPPAGD